MGSVFCQPYTASIHTLHCRLSALKDTLHDTPRMKVEMNDTVNKSNVEKLVMFPSSP